MLGVLRQGFYLHIVEFQEIVNSTLSSCYKIFAPDATIFILYVTEF